MNELTRAQIYRLRCSIEIALANEPDCVEVIASMVAKNLSLSQYEAWFDELMPIKDLEEDKKVQTITGRTSGDTQVSETPQGLISNAPLFAHDDTEIHRDHINKLPIQNLIPMLLAKLEQVHPRASATLSAAHPVALSFLPSADQMFLAAFYNVPVDEPNEVTATVVVTITVAPIDEE